jgi:hypothetical protein
MMPRHHAPLLGEASENPNDWDELRAQGHRVLDDMIDYIATIRERLVWQAVPDAMRAHASSFAQKPAGSVRPRRSHAERRSGSAWRLASIAACWSSSFVS